MTNMNLPTYVHLREQLNAQRCHINERLHIGNNTKSARIKLTTRDELRNLIEHELEHQGTDADLNFIDTSEITDMSYLFKDLDIRNIKIDKWNTSKVTKMNGLFLRCKDFNA